MKACSPRGLFRSVAILLALVSAAACAGDTPTGVVPVVLGRSTFEPDVSSGTGEGTAVAGGAAESIRPGTTASPEGARARPGE